MGDTGPVRFRFFVEWRTDSWLWAVDVADMNRYGNPADSPDLPLSPDTRADMARLAEWHDSSLNWDDPMAPGPWREAECERFNAAARGLLATIRAELGLGFEVIDEFVEVHEDSKLDA